MIKWILKWGLCYWIFLFIVWWIFAPERKDPCIEAQCEGTQKIITYESLAKNRVDTIPLVDAEMGTLYMGVQDGTGDYFPMQVTRGGALKVFSTDDPTNMNVYVVNK